MTFMDGLPRVISCCFCCFLRAGTILISLISFFAGLVFIPNLNHTPGLWDLDKVLGNFSDVTEYTVQILLGIVSILLCVASFLLLMGVCFNMVNLILMYQYGAIIYGGVIFVLFFILAAFCFFVYSDCKSTGFVLVMLMVVDVFCTLYFVIVTNSLRISMKEVLSELL